jgi:hypothetical protein
MNGWASGGGRSEIYCGRLSWCFDVETPRTLWQHVGSRGQVRGRHDRPTHQRRADAPAHQAGFDPIEQAFGKLKSYLREACARSQQELMEVIGEAMSTISTSDAVTSSSTAATGQWFNLYDRRFRLAPRGPREPVVQLVTGGYDDLGSRCRVLRGSSNGGIQ